MMRNRATTASLRRLDGELAALADRGLSASAFRHEALARVRHVIPVDGWCCSSADPESLVMTAVDGAGVDRGLTPAFYGLEYGRRDFSAHAALARTSRRARVLHHETDGHPGRSARYREFLRPMGFEHELRAAATERGVTWGFLHLYRARGRRGFDAREADAIRRASAHIAAGLRAASIAPAQAGTSLAEPLGMVVLDGCDKMTARFGMATEWLREMADPGTMLPDVVQSLVWSARSSAGAPVRAHLRGGDGRWWALEGVPADSAALGEGSVAVVIQAGGGTHLARLMMLAFGLSPGERELCELVLSGRSTREIAAELVLSPHTVQDRLKSVFAKSGVRSRRDLVARFSAARDDPLSWGVQSSTQT